MCIYHLGLLISFRHWPKCEYSYHTQLCSLSGVLKLRNLMLSTRVVIPEIRFFANDGRLYSFETNLRQRVAWMRQKSSDEEFRVELHRRDKKARYHSDLLALFQMYVNVVGELFQNLVVQKSLESYPDIVALKKYTRGHLVTIKERYGSQCTKYDRYISDFGGLETI
jgi:hypothetical protein